MVRNSLKTLLYKTGLLRTWQRVRDRRTLTVVMFHRVLPPGHPRWATADPTWTVTDELLRDCLKFFLQHYNIVGLADLLRAQAKADLLPDRALLITFDDGWADNEEFALPVLQQVQVPAVVFVAPEGVKVGELWDECLRRHGRLGKLANPEQRIADLVNCKPDVRAAKLDSLWPDRTIDPVMLSADGIRKLDEAGVAIACHGLTHTPIPLAWDPVFELVESRRRMADLAGSTSHLGLSAMSYPHGRYTDAILEHSCETGFRLLFTSDPELTSTKGGSLPPVLGRINISAADVADGDGRLRPERMATWLFGRPVVSRTGPRMHVYSL
jgi:peptidoglycan/xylan/chitin deacetylase (PgdA/CDA1 family)